MVRSRRARVMAVGASSSEPPAEAARSTDKGADNDPPIVVFDLPARLLPTSAEISILRAYLAADIDAILRDEE